MEKNDPITNTSFVGLGLAGVRGFSTFVDGLYQDYRHDPQAFAAKYQAAPQHIELIDKYITIGGLAYDRSRSPVPLLIHNSTESLSPVGEFHGWITDNKERLIAYMHEFGQEHAVYWLEKHTGNLDTLCEDVTADNVKAVMAELQEAGDLTPEEAASLFQDYDESWRMMRIPRAVYGLFMEDEIGRAIAQLGAMEHAGITFQAWQGEAERIRPVEGSTDVRYAFKDDMATPMSWQFVGGGIDLAHPADDNLIGASTSHYAFKPAENAVSFADAPDRQCQQMGYFLGIPTPKDWPAFAAERWQSYFPNMYAHQPEDGRAAFQALTDSITTYERDKTDEEKVEIVVLGNKASAADLWVWAMSDPALKPLVEQRRIRFTHISGNGAAEVRPAARHSNPDYDIGSFIARVGQIDSAEVLIAAYKHGIEVGTSVSAPNGNAPYNHYDIVQALNPIISMKLGISGACDGVEPLSAEECHIWHHGNGQMAWSAVPATQFQILNFLTAPETVDARDELRTYEAVDDVAGRFIAEQASREGGRWHIPLESGEVVTGDIVVNAAGYGPNNATRANLAPLLESGMARQNTHGTGFDIDEDTFKTLHANAPLTAPNFYTYGITARGSIQPGDPYKRSGTAAGNQSQLDPAVRAIAGKMLENIGVEGFQHRSFATESSEAAAAFMR